MNRGSFRSRHSVIGALLGIIGLGIVWAIAARSQPEIILPSPRETWNALMTLARSGTLFEEMAETLYRTVTGVAIALVLGGFWGTINGVSLWASAISRPAVSALMAVPPIVLVSLGLIWFGPGDGVTRLVIVLVALPLIVVTVQEAVHNVDDGLLEMASAFRLPRSKVLRHVIVPGIASPVLAATSVMFGQSIRVAVMSEVLSSVDGVGAQIARAQSNLDTAKIFAWTIVIVLVVIALETLVLRPFTNWLLRWRSAPATERALGRGFVAGPRG